MELIPEDAITERECRGLPCFTKAELEVAQAEARALGLYHQVLDDDLAAWPADEVNLVLSAVLHRQFDGSYVTCLVAPLCQSLDITPERYWRLPRHEPDSTAAFTPEPRGVTGATRWN